MHWILSLIGVGAIVSLCATLIVSEVKNMHNVHAQNLVTLGDAMAEQVCYLFHDKNLFNGSAIMPRIQEAAKTLQDKLSAEGFSVTIQNATEMVQAAHARMTLDKGTAYNDAPKAAA